MAIPIETWNDFSHAIKAGNGSPVKLEISRPQGNSSVHETIVITPTRIDQKTIYGSNAPTWIIGVQPKAVREKVEHYGPIRAVREACYTTVEITGQTVIGIAGIFGGSVPVKDALGGPIQIAQMAGKEAHAGFANLAMFTVMLSLNLGM